MLQHLSGLQKKLETSKQCERIPFRSHSVDSSKMSSIKLHLQSTAEKIIRFRFHANSILCLLVNIFPTHIKQAYFHSIKFHEIFWSITTLQATYTFVFTFIHLKFDLILCLCVYAYLQEKNERKISFISLSFVNFDWSIQAIIG